MTRQQQKLSLLQLDISFSVGDRRWAFGTRGMVIGGRLVLILVNVLMLVLMGFTPAILPLQ